MRRLGLVLLAGGLLGLTAEWVGFGWGDPRHWIPDLAVGWTFVGSGLIAWARRPASRTGPLLAATGFTWFLGNFAQVGVAAVAWAAAHLVYLHRGPLVQLVLTYPSGRPGSRLVRGAVAVGYAAAVITPSWRKTGALDGGAGRCRAEPGACRNRSGSPAAAAGGGQRPVAARVRGGAVRPCGDSPGRSPGGPMAAGGGHRPGRRTRRGPLGHASR